MKKKEVILEVLTKIRLPVAEILKIQEQANKLIQGLKFNGLKAQIGGSLAKGTMVDALHRSKEKGAGEHALKRDVDIFVVFERSEEIPTLEKVLNKMQLPGKLTKRHGSRDYFQIETKDLILEIIPVVKNHDPELAENVTDVSLSHVKYVRGKIQSKPELADEILLAKSFARALHIYGAESYIKGFSGYSLEVLIIHFGSFEKFLKNIGKKSFIDPCKYFKNEREAMREINESKTKGPLVVIDPTHKYRNVVAGLSKKSLDKLINAGKIFLKKPTVEAFEKKEINKEEWKKKARKKQARFVEITIVTDRQEGDIAGTKCRKFFDYFISELTRKQQKIIEEEFEYTGFGNQAKGYLIIKEKKEIETKGPSTGLADAAEKFRNKRGIKVFEKGNYLYKKETVNIKQILQQARRVENEMGAGGKITEFV